MVFFFFLFLFFYFGKGFQFCFNNVYMTGEGNITRRDGTTDLDLLKDEIVSEQLTRYCTQDLRYLTHWSFLFIPLSHAKNLTISHFPFVFHGTSAYHYQSDLLLVV